MAKRKYDPKLQAEHSQLLRNFSDTAWSQFHGYYPAFNAMYNAAPGKTERDRVKRVIEKHLSEQVAIGLLQRFVDAKLEIPSPPPGDTRLADDDPDFRKQACVDAATAQDITNSGTKRLAAMMSLVYNVRCSLLHGNKSPESYRDNELVRWGGQILELVIPELEKAME